MLETNFVVERASCSLEKHEAVTVTVRMLGYDRAEVQLEPQNSISPGRSTDARSCWA